MPKLQQVFYVGDGKVNGSPRSYAVPAGATRLYLGKHRRRSTSRSRPADHAEPAAAPFGDDEIEVVFRFQELSKAWLEDRLARVEQLKGARGDAPGAG